MSAKPIDIADSIIGAVAGVTKDWAKQRKAEERDRSRLFRRHDALVRIEHVSIKEAAFEVMDKAYAKVSDNGRLPARPRQIMYAARPQILDITGKDYLSDSYFTQTLLPDYINEHRHCRNWDVVWDARGHFAEPHTGVEVGLGTLEIRKYVGLRAVRRDAITVDTSVLYLTSGPEHRYNTILFIEKEGFGPLFAAEHIAERYDLAIMSTKGMSVTAARELLDLLAKRGVEQVLVLHDFDISGFSIFGTLGTSGRRYAFRNKIKLIDLGLRLAVVEEMGLEDEPVSVGKDWDKVSATLRRHGATRDEIAFLRNDRVELNAMTSPQLISFIEGKLAEHGIKKLVPDEATLTQHASRLIEQQVAAAAIKKLRAELSEEAAKTPVPPDLRKAVEQRLAEEPLLPWDAALADVLRSDAAS
jgi:DNA topoisomerase 6 subunit A-like protein